VLDYTTVQSIDGGAENDVRNDGAGKKGNMMMMMMMMDFDYY
jgi:hypothetical protein